MQNASPRLRSVPEIKLHGEWDHSLEELIADRRLHVSGELLVRLFAETAAYYDLIYDAIGKDYRSESRRLTRLIRRYKKTTGNALLDIACGTGRHILHLKSYFDVEGLDIDRNLLRIARRRNAGIRFQRGNMLTFKLGRSFDAITCLFSAIGHMTTVTELEKAVRNMSFHLKPGGVLIIEPWITPRDFKRGTIDVVVAKQPELKIVRVGRSFAHERISTLEFHYLIATPRKIRHLMETADFGLFTHSEYLSAFHTAGLKATYEKRGLIGRGLYIGVKK
jgi:SAM-dependent methyltransferase